MNKVITREREKLYVQMEENFENLQELNPDKLFLHLRTETKNGKLSFSHYSEFLNILNTILLFYSCTNNLKKCSFNISILLLMDISFLIFSLLFHFITRIKKIHKDNSRQSFIFALSSIVLSKLLFKKNFDLRHKNLIFSFILLMSYTYSTKSNHTSSMLTKICYTGLAFVMSTQVESLLLKLRIFFYAINYFEFVPEIRKFIANYSQTHNLFAFLINTLTVFGFLLYSRDMNLILLMVICVILVCLLYPLVFNHYYKEKRPILGLWNLPKVVSYY